MRKPSHIAELEKAGSSYAALQDFRTQMSSFRITVIWNPNHKCWILGKVPRTGPTFISCKVDVISLVSMFADPMAVAGQFEEMEIA